jgi:glycosyltransferase involved in cell wall biosynthesis
LASVSPWVSEIIVVLNQDVKDGTEEIALQHGAKVFREPWRGHVAQKNSAAEKATQEWVLGLDADEVVSPELREEVYGALAATDHNKGLAAFSFPRLSWYCGRWIRHGDWYPDRQTRLWRRSWAKWGGVDPHDKLLVDGRVGRLSANLLHYSNDSIAQHVQKIGPYADEFVRRNGGRGDSVGVFDLVVRPAWRFLRAYLLRLGFLDGWQGYYIACLNAFSSLTRHARLKEPPTDANPGL